MSDDIDLAAPVDQLAEQHLGFSRADTGAMNQIYDAMLDLSDSGSCDRGFGADYADIWVTIGGVEYYLTVRRSKKQRAEDGRS